MSAVYIGVDGGASKTEAVAARDGKILAMARTGPSNPQGPVGFDGAMDAVGQAVSDVMARAGVGVAAVRRAVLGLAGADFPEDIAKMTEGLQQRLPGLSFAVVNDTQIALAGGSRSGFGIAVICGTATNVLARRADGQQFSVGGMGYEMGDYGGGADLARDVLHHAFRSAEGRGPKTLLEEGVLERLGQPDYASLRRAMYFGAIHPYAFLALVPLCFESARQGDKVAEALLRTMADALAASVMAAARALPFDRGEMEVITVGSLWNGASDLLRTHFGEIVGEAYPACDIHAPCLSPAAGALLMASGADDPGQEALRRRLASQEDMAPER